MRGGAVFRAVGVMPSKDDGAGTDTFDRISPMGNAEHRQQPSPYGMASGTFHHKTEWLSSVFRDALPDKDFYDRPLTHRLNSIHRKEQCRNDGTFRSSSLRHTSFLSGLHRFSFFSVSIHRRHRWVGDDLCFHGLSSGGAFSTRRTINKWVSTSCLP